MLDAVLETIGALAVLASIVAKFVYLRAAPRLGENAAEDGAPADRDAADHVAKGSAGPHRPGGGCPGTAPAARPRRR